MLGENRCQGDVFFVKIKKIPKNTKIVKRNRLVEGEATGHHHSIDVSMKKENELSHNVYVTTKGELYIQNEKDIVITHQEHDTITLTPGNWKVDQQQEYDPFEEEIRNVRD